MRQKRTLLAHVLGVLLGFSILLGVPDAGNWDMNQAYGGAPGRQQDLMAAKVIFVGPTPPAAVTYNGTPSFLFVDAKDWKPLRIGGDPKETAPLTQGTLMYQTDRRYEHFSQIVSFVAAAPLGVDAIRQRAGRSPLGAVLLAHAVSQHEGMAALDATRRELGEEGYAWGLRIFGHSVELAACAQKSPDCLYELVTLNIESGSPAAAAELLSKQPARFDTMATTLHDAQDWRCAPVRKARAGGPPATGLSWAALLRIALLEQTGMKPKADAERGELARRAPHYEESLKEGYYEDYGPLDHVLFKHDRPRVLYQCATESRPASP